MTVTTQHASTIINGLEPEHLKVALDGSVEKDLSPTTVLNVPIENILVLKNAKKVGPNGMVYVGSVYAGCELKAAIFQ